MSEPTTTPKIPKIAIVLILLGVAALIVIFTVLATIGDDVPSEIAPASQTARGE